MPPDRFAEFWDAYPKRVAKQAAEKAWAKALAGGVQVFPDTLDASVPLLRKGQIGAEVSAALFGVGYILGPRVSAVEGAAG